MAKGATSVDVHFPEGTVWRSVWTGTEYEAKNSSVTQAVDAPLGEPPLFLRVRPDGDSCAKVVVASAVAERLALLLRL